MARSGQRPLRREHPQPRAQDRPPQYASATEYICLLATTGCAVSQARCHGRGGFNWVPTAGSGLVSSSAPVVEQGRTPESVVIFLANTPSTYGSPCGSSLEGTSSFPSTL